MKTMDEIIKGIPVIKSHFAFCAKEGVINGTLLAGIKCAMEEHANNKNLKQSELIRKSFDLIGEIIDNCDADAIDLPPDLYDELKFHWKQLQKSI